MCIYCTNGFNQNETGLTLNTSLSLYSEQCGVWVLRELKDGFYAFVVVQTLRKYLS